MEIQEHSFFVGAPGPRRPTSGEALRIEGDVEVPDCRQSPMQGREVHQPTTIGRSHCGPIVVPFTCNIPGMHGAPGCLFHLFGARHSGGIKTVITDSCAQNCRVHILSRRVPEFLIFSRPLVWNGCIFR